VTWRQRWRQEGGAGELLQLAFPLILSNSLLTFQLFIERIFLSQLSSAAVAAAMPAGLLYWTLISLPLNTANYATTFVAQYSGAARPERVGPSVWQALYFSVAVGLLFFCLYPLAGPLLDLGRHSPAVRQLEVTYFRCLCFAALPALLTASLNSFFAGRGDSWTVLVVDAAGLTTTATLAYAWIFGHWGLPAWGIAGAGWAIVVGSSVSTLVALALFLRSAYRERFQTLAGWRFEAALFQRLMRFGVPNGMLWMLDGLAFLAFLFLVGWLGDVELAATNITFNINMLAIIPMLGIGHAVSILVGQRLGQEKPELAARSAWTGFALAWLFITSVAVLYVTIPNVFLYFFQNQEANWEQIARLVPVLLRFVAVYSLFDSMNIIFSFTLRGAGDTRFVTVMALGLAWPLMVFPTWMTWYFGWGLYWAWAFASAYVIALGLTFLLRVRTGKWKTMRVIETQPPVEPSLDEAAPAEGVGSVALSQLAE
jgi:MATE family multidrug resistance protein